MHITGTDRNQIRITCWDDFVPADSPARQIDKFVDEMDTSYFLFSTHNAVGRRPYNPKDMLKLYLYGNDKGVFSSRKLERECRENIIFFWLLNGLQPESKTICNFRKDNAENLKRFFHEFAKRLATDGLITGKFVGIDGTKLRANNAGNKCFNMKCVNQEIEQIERKIAEYMEEVDKNDEIEKLVDRREKLISIKDKIESGDVKEVSMTDPDSRMMRMSNGGANVCHNIQAAVDSKNKLIAGFEVVSNQNDQGLLHNVAKSVKDNLSIDEMIVIADARYYDAEELGKCHEEGIETLVSPLEPNKNTKGFSKKKFQYDEQTNTYICPAGKRLKYITTSGGRKHYRNLNACKNCPLKPKCTKGKYRAISHSVNYQAIKRNMQAILENKVIYKARGAICEHPFGTIKKNMRFVQFLLRGNARVSGETALLFIVYNLKRLRNMNKNDKHEGGYVQKYHCLMKNFAKYLYLPIFYFFSSKTHIFAPGKI